MVERRRSNLRTAVVWNALADALQTRQQAVDRPLSVVDLGGGTGGLAVRVAAEGHQVVVVDPSPDALASLGRRATDAGVGDTVTGILGDAATLHDVAEPGSVDLVLCHGVLEVVDEPAEALAAVATALAPGGCLSVVAAQRSAAVFNRALAGHLAEARTLLADPDGRWGPADPMPRRFSQPELETLLADAGFSVAAARGVRVFVDHISSTLVDEPGVADELLALEISVAANPDFMPMAAALHLLALRD